MVGAAQCDTAGVRYVIFGAGAVGGVIGARLHAAGHPVALVARGAHLDAIRSGGLRLETPTGSEHHAVAAFASMGAAEPSGDDVVILTVKSNDTDAALDQLVAEAPPETPVVCAQNGVANETKALRRFRSVYGLCVILPSQFTEPGIVTQYSSPHAGVLDLGRYPDGVDDTARRIAADLTSATFLSEPHPTIMALKYRKLLMNLSNALDALCGWEARQSPLADRAGAEASACFAAAGIEIQSTADEQARRTAGLHLAPTEAGAHRGSSSWQSLERGTGSIETDYLNGEIVLLGRLHGVPTPVNEALQRLAAEAARTHRPAGTVPEHVVEQLAGAIAGGV